jgi:hypothetical protein
MLHISEFSRKKPVPPGIREKRGERLVRESSRALVRDMNTLL